MAIGSRALDILGVLIERPGDLVSRAAMMDAVWPETAVEDSNLNVQVAALRRILDEDREQGSCIQTVSGRGTALLSRLSGKRQMRLSEPRQTPAMAALRPVTRLRY